MDLQGKTAVISGGTSGIGKATALKLASRGAEVIVIGRDPTRGAELEAALRQASGGAGAFVPADLSLIGEARQVVSTLAGRLQKIDALIHSAGVIDRAPSTTREGLDKVFVTNFLHKLVLAEGLRPLLARARGRMVLVAAAVPDRMVPDWGNFEGRRVYSGVTALPRLQGASLSVAQHLAAEWKADGIEVTALHPGQVDTGIYRNFDRWPWTLAHRVMKLFFVPVERPAELTCWLAFSPEASGLSGHLFPSVKNFRKHRALRRDPAGVQRVLRTARAVLDGQGATAAP
jgi:NAD(P)-dependent dehydrogenase (short-subunit alcohol dehydrogenase family)